MRAQLVGDVPVMLHRQNPGELGLAETVPPSQPDPDVGPRLRSG